MILQHIGLFKTLLTVASKIGITTTKWDPNQLLLISSENTLQTSNDSVKPKMWIQTIFCIALTSQIVHSLIYYNVSLANRIMYGITLIALLVTNVYLRSSFKQTYIQCAYVNGIIQTATCYASHKSLSAKRKYSLVEKLNLTAAYLLAPTATIFQLAFVFGLHSLSACKPTLVGYLIIPECQSTEEPLDYGIFNKIVKFVIFLFNHWVWTISVHLCPYFIAGIQILCALTFNDFLSYFDRMSDFGCQLSLYRASLMYRKIQILNGLCNEFQQNPLTIVLMTASIVIQAISMAGVALIPWKEDNYVALVCCTQAMIYGTLVVLVYLGGMAKIFQKSKQVLHRKRLCSVNISKSRDPCNLKWSNKFYLSCTPVRFRFGNVNYIDRLTPLTCTVFANRLTLQFLLLGIKTHEA